MVGGKVSRENRFNGVLSSRMMATGNCRFYSQSEHEFIGHDWYEWLDCFRYSFAW